MKNYILLVILFLFSGFILNAQTKEELKKTEKERQKKEKEFQKHREKVQRSLEKKQAIISLDTLFFEGRPQCLVSTEKQSIFSGKDYTFKSFDGTGLINCRYEANVINSTSSAPYYSYTFFETGLMAEEAMSIGNYPYQTVAKKGLIKDGKTDTAAIKRFVMVIGNKFTDRQNNPKTVLIINSNSSHKLIDRNKQGMVMIMGQDIMQSNVKIGYFIKKSEAIQGSIQWVTSFYLPDGTFIGEAIAPDLQPKTVDLITKKDNQWHTVETSFGNDTRDIADYLIRNLYL